MMEDVGVGQVIPIRNNSIELLNFVVGRDGFGQWIVAEMHGPNAEFSQAVMQQFASPSLSVVVDRERFGSGRRSG